MKISNPGAARGSDDTPRQPAPRRSKWAPGGWNKMKPTNPNADTYVDKQRQYLFVTFPTNSLVRHPEFTHWGDTLVGHPCLTLLRNALVGHSCLTLVWDTLVRHFLLDTLVKHSYVTLLLDTLVRHSCKTLLAWHSYLTLRICHFLFGTSYLTLLQDNSYVTLL